MAVTLEKYIEDKYYDKVFNAVLNYYSNNKGHMDLHTYAVPYPTFIRLTDIYVDKVKFKDDIFSKKTEFKLDVTAEFTLKGDRFNDYEEDIRNRKFIVTCVGLIDDPEHKVRIIDVDEKDRSPYAYKEGLSSLLIPYIPFEDLDKRACEFLTKYYPDALKVPMALPINELLGRMGVTAYHAPLGNKVFGKAFFSASKEKIYNDDNEIMEVDIPERTILIDPDVYFFRNMGSYNNTAVHECIHLEYHSKFFEILKLTDETKKSIACKQGKMPQKLSGQYQKALDLMEWQASMLAPRILMPECTTRIKYGELINEVVYEYPNSSKGKQMDVLIERLADFFKVSKQAAKIRLIDLGIDTAIGTCNYINGKTYPSFSFRPQSLEKNQTYVIDFIDSIIQIKMNPELDKLSKAGKITYANGMVVINSEKYVRVNDSGEKVLTEYALNHVDECALIFTKKSGTSGGAYNSYLDSICFLCRSEDNKEYISSTYDKNVDKNKCIVAYATEMEDEQFDNEEALELIKKMNGSFREDFIVLIENAGYVHKDGTPNYSSLKRITGIDDKTLESYASGKTKPPKNKVLAICAAFELHPRVSYHFLKKAGFDIQNSMDTDDYLYCGLIERHYTEGLDSWNRRISSLNKSELLL